MSCSFILFLLLLYPTFSTHLNMYTYIYQREWYVYSRIKNNEMWFIFTLFGLNLLPTRKKKLSKFYNQPYNTRRQISLHGDKNTKYGKQIINNVWNLHVAKFVINQIPHNMGLHLMMASTNFCFLLFVQTSSSS